MVRSLTKRGMPKPFAILIAVLMALYFVPFSALSSASAAAGDPVVTQESGINGCEGVRTTPGSENTDKRLIAGNLEPGGTVTFQITYPVDPTDVAGRTTFVITDCVFIDGDAALKYTVSFVPNTTDFILTFNLVIPPDAPIGAQYCNFAKTTAAPSQSQASNRKAGPACFFIGGDLRIVKVASGDATHTPLPGASFDVSCPTTVTVPAVIISGLVDSQGDPVPTVDQSASGKADTGVIAIAGPAGTVCTVTETAAPPGYELPANPTHQYTIPNGSAQSVEYFENTAVGSLVVRKTADMGGSFTFDVDCNDGTSHDVTGLVIQIPVGGGTVTSDPITGIPAGTQCTATERDNQDFTTVVDPATGKVTIQGGQQSVVHFTNTRKTGALKITKIADATGTFTFDVTCDNGLTRSNIPISIDAGHLGSPGVSADLISGIPTGVSCTVTEDNNPDFTTTVTPGGGTVTISTGDNEVTFTNTRKTGDLKIVKIANATGTFHFDVTCNNGFTQNNIPISIDANHLGSPGVSADLITGIPTGTTCTVTEQEDPNFTKVVTPTDGVIVIGTGTNTVTFTNTRKLGSLTISKTTVGGAGTFTFDVDCDGTAYDRTGSDAVVLQVGADATGSVVVASGIPTGTVCTVTERDNPDFTKTAEVPDNGQVTIDTNGETVSFTNTRKTGSLTISKTTVGGAGTFTFDVDCDATAFDRTGDNPVVLQVGADATESVVVASGIPTGTVCTVTERDNPDFTKTAEVPDNGQVTIDTNGETVSFTNTRDVGQIAIHKALQGDVAGASTDFTAHVDCTGDAYDQDVALTAPDWTGTTGDIPTGVECTITETGIPAGWSLVSISPDHVTVGGGDPVAVTITNKRDTGVITVTKVLVGAANGAATSFTFDVDCPGTAYDQSVVVSVTNGTSASATTTAIPTGLSCTVTERATPDWRVTAVVPAGGVVAVGSTVTFTNTRLEGTLNIAKKVSPVAGNGVVVNFGDTLTYTLTVSATGDQRQPNAVTWDYLPGRDPAHPTSGNTTYVAGSATCIGTGPCTVDGPDASGKITWHLGEMAAGTTRLVTFKVVINDVTGAAGATIAEDIINQATVQSDRTPATRSNVVKTPVSKVLPVKIGPKELPHTGAFLPVGPTVGGGILLLGLGLLLVATTRRRRGQLLG
jgi:Domain of unknown function (DUF5979)